jgi:hypothetical protein
LTHQIQQPAALRTLRPLLSDLAAQLEGQKLDDIVFPHALSGPLDARQRLQFLRFHIDRHLGQLQRVRASVPSTGLSESS